MSPRLFEGVPQRALLTFALAVTTPSFAEAPKPSDPGSSPLIEAAEPLASTSPAAQGEIGSATPHAGQALVERFAAARKRIEAARAAADAVNARWARAMYHKEPEGPQRDAIEEERIRAERELTAARAAVGPLIEEARQAGVSDHLLEVYQKGVAE